MNDKLAKAMNDQIQKEFYSAYLYLAMSAYFESVDLKGFANWMHVQFQEETALALRFFAYMHDRGARVELQAIEQPKVEWESALDAMQETLAHEKMVTASINNLADIAVETRDHAALSMLQWFVDEQVEEESNATDIIAQLKLIGDNGYGLLMLDKELRARVFVAPTFGAAAAE